jgi:LysM repeat protein
MVFQSLLSSSVGMSFTDSSNALVAGSGSLVGLKDRPAGRSFESQVALGKVDMIGLTRTFSGFPPEQAARRPVVEDGAGWSAVETGLGGPHTTLQRQESAAALPDALDALLQGEQLAPIWCTQRNYGTFSRQTCTYSAAVSDHTSASRKASAPSAAPSEAQKAPVSSATPFERASSEAAHPRADTEALRREESLGDGEAFTEHAVATSDSVSALAIRYRVSVTDIMRANGMTGSSQRSDPAPKTWRDRMGGCARALKNWLTRRKES